MDTLLDHYGHDEELLVSNAMTFVVGGFHTTGNFLTWTFYYLSIYPHMQEKVFEEIKDVLGQKGHLDERNMRNLTCVSIRVSHGPYLPVYFHCSYLNAFLNESHRNCNIAPFVARVDEAHDRKIAGHVIPAGTPIMLSNTTAFMDEQYFPDPTKYQAIIALLKRPIPRAILCFRFDPSRFMPDENKKRPSCAFSPFSFGPRKCIGYRFAHFEAMAAVVAIIRRFVIRPAFPNDFYIEPVHGFVCKPSTEIWLKIRQREGNWD